MKWPNDARFKISGDTLARPFRGENLALVHMRTKRTHVLNSTAATIWKMVTTGSSVEEIGSLLARDYAVEESEAAQEVQSLLTLLSDEHFIERL